MPEPKTGPLTFQEIQAIWEAAVDDSYKQSLIEAGEGRGFEAHTQAFTQSVRVSRAIDITTQAMFILPWSGQTNPPAGGAVKATVTLTFRRTRLLEKPLVLKAGQTFYEEQQIDWGRDGGVDVLTGRRYTLTEDCVFAPGEQGPIDVPAIAEKPGYGYNNPLPDTIKYPVQLARDFTNNLATVTVAVPAALGSPAATVTITTPNEADTFVAEHIGQYVRFEAGLNVTRSGRILSFTPPDSTVPRGSIVTIAIEQAFDATTFTGTFERGEVITFNSTTATGKVVGEVLSGGRKKVVYELLSGGPVAIGDTVTGISSGATATVLTMLFPELEVSETSSATWKILEWVVDWGLAVTHPLSPQGGVAAFLDELGSERAIDRGPGEPDDIYRQRVAEIADVVSPNAIRRTLSRVLGGYPWCFREVGSADLRGFFYDGDRSPVGTLTTLAIADKNDAYDYDVIILNGTTTSGTFNVFQEKVEVRIGLSIIATGYLGRIAGGTVMTIIRKTGTVTATAGVTVVGLVTGAVWTPSSIVDVSAAVNRKRFREYFDYTQFRAFFLVGLPRLNLGEFGFPYDGGTATLNAYDGPTPINFYDGYPVGAAALYASVWKAVNAVRAGGVTFELYIEDIGCP